MEVFTHDSPEGKVFSFSKRQGLVPDVFTYNTLISACRNGNQLERALEIFQEMKQQGVLPDVITYSTLISAYDKVNQLKQAFELFEAMK